MTKNSQKCFALKAFCLGVMLLFSQNVVFAEDEGQSAPQSENQIIQSENLTPASEQASPSGTWQWSSAESEQARQQPSTFGLFLKMVFALAVVLFLAYIVVRLLKRGVKLGNSDDPFLRHVSHLALSANRSVDVVTILNHAYILGVSDNAVNLIAQIEDSELVNSMNLYADKNDNNSRPRSFEDILNIFMPANGGKNQNIYGSSAKNAAEVLQRQRSRLNEEQ